MSDSDWDFDRQRSETKDTLENLKTEQGVTLGGEVVVTLDVFLAPGPDADQEALERALAMFGYSGELMEDEETSLPVFAVSVEETSLTLEDIWLHEERISKIALSRGFTPSGWGFFEP